MMGHGGPRCLGLRADHSPPKWAVTPTQKCPLLSLGFVTRPKCFKASDWQGRPPGIRARSFLHDLGPIK